MTRADAAQFTASFDRALDEEWQERQLSRKLRASAPTLLPYKNVTLKLCQSCVPDPDCMPAGGCDPNGACEKGCGFAFNRSSYDDAAF
jgi:hypothetical protein